MKDYFQSIYTVSSRRTSSRFAEESFNNAFDILQQQFQLFKKISVIIDSNMMDGGGFQINFVDDVSDLDHQEISRGLEEFIKVIYDDINEESGLYFITEIRNHLDRQSINRILEMGIDLDKIQNEQHNLYARKKRKKERMETTGKSNPLGYEWGLVNNWNYNDESKQVELYDKNGNILDKIDLHQAIKYYVESLSGITGISSIDLENLLEEHEKSYSFLKFIYQENLGFETAKNMLNLTDEEIKMIIKELIELKFLQYGSNDEIKITESGKKFIRNQ